MQLPWTGARRGQRIARVSARLEKQRRSDFQAMHSAAERPYMSVEPDENA